MKNRVSGTGTGRDEGAVPATGLRSRRDFARSLFLAGAGLPLAGSFLSAGPLISPLPGEYKVNIFSKHLQFLDYDDMAEAAAQAGADGVDLTVRPGGHVLPENVERDLPLAAKAIREAGLELTMMTTAITDAGDPMTETILRVASDLGIRYYRTGWYRYDPDLEIEENLDIFREKLSRLAVLNEKYRIHGAYQNHAGEYFGAPVWDLWLVIRDLDPEWTGCQYDIRHAVVEGAHTWPLGLELLKEHIRCMVAKDFQWTEEQGTWRIKNVPIGEGMVDFRAYFSRLHELGISGPVSLHIEYPLFPDREDMPPGQKESMAVSTIRRDIQSLRELM
jgi:L-ribulose-5-phosphate 3-epimerase